MEVKKKLLTIKSYLCKVKKPLICVGVAIALCGGGYLYLQKHILNLGVYFVETLYHGNSLEAIGEKQSERLRQYAIDPIVNLYALDINTNRLEYAYYGMEKGKLSPVYRKWEPGYIEYTVSIDGKDNGRIVGLWYKTNGRKITEVTEAYLYPFKIDEVEEGANE